MEKALVIETGAVTYHLNGVCDLTFNPTDTAYVERLYNTFEELDRKQEAYKAEVEKAQKKEIFDIAKRRDAEMREMIDNALGAPVCDAVFHDMNVYALADGLPVWANLLLAIMDEMDTTFAEEQKRTNVRLRKYSDKYKRK